MDGPFLARKPNKSLTEENISQGIVPDLSEWPGRVHKDFFDHVRVGYCQPRIRPKPVQEGLPVHPRPPVVERSSAVEDVVVEGDHWLRLSIGVDSPDFGWVTGDQTVAGTPNSLLSEVVLDSPWDPYERVHKLQKEEQENQRKKENNIHGEQWERRTSEGVEIYMHILYNMFNFFFYKANDVVCTSWYTNH